MLVSGPTPDEAATIGRHVAHCAVLGNQGVMLMVGRTQTTTPDTMGLAVFIAEDEAAARAIMESDPAVMEGVMTADLFPYRIAFGNADAFRSALEAADQRPP
jgi:uncharacterized protein YciI